MYRAGPELELQSAVLYCPTARDPARALSPQQPFNLGKQHARKPVEKGASQLIKVDRCRGRRRRAWGRRGDGTVMSEQ